MTARVLRKKGVRCDVYPSNDVADVRKGLDSLKPTHAVIQAIWISSEDQAELCVEFPNVQFVVRCHSQIGFLQVEPDAIKILRDLMYLQELQLNLTVSSNTLRLQDFLQNTYKSKVLHLANLYDIERVHRKIPNTSGHRLLRIGSFGAHRLLKNHTTAAAAAMMIAERRGSDLEFYVSTGREEGSNNDPILRSMKAMFSRVPWAKLIEAPWEEWSQFRQTVAFMDLCMQVSFTETFNIVTADAITEGVPSVVSDAIEWAPLDWQASVDDASDVARIGTRLLCDLRSAEDGLKSLEKYQKQGVYEWLTYLASNPTV